MFLNLQSASSSLPPSRSTAPTRTAAHDLQEWPYITVHGKSSDRIKEHEVYYIDKSRKDLGESDALYVRSKIWKPMLECTKSPGIPKL